MYSFNQQGANETVEDYNTDFAEMIADFIQLQKCYEAVQTAWDKF